MWKRRVVLSVLIFLGSAVAEEKPKTMSVGDALNQSAKLSQITFPGSRAFHLKASAAELNSPDSDFKAEIEEYWAAPDKWRRTVKTPNFSQTIIANGDQVLEQNEGDYLPSWLRNLTTALLDLAPDELRRSQVQFSSGVPVLEQLAKKDPRFGGLVLSPNSEFCSRSSESVGVPPVQNTIFASLCFRGQAWELKRISTPYYDAEFAEYKKFGDKQVARKITMYIEPGTMIETHVLTLEDWTRDDKLFAIEKPTPQPVRITTMRLSEAAARQQLMGSPEIVWNPVRDGKTSGTLSIFMSVDREGHVRETRPLNSDNPFPQDQARKEVMQWHFKPMVVDGAPQQMETVLTFAYKTQIGDAIPVLSDTEARKLALQTAEPEFHFGKPAKGTSFTVRVAVGENGDVIGLKNVNNLDLNLLGAANLAMHKWRFRPYIHNGKPDRWDADITFHVE